MQIGSAVKLVQPTLQGAIIDTRYDKEALTLTHLVEWADASGVVHQRWFNESEIAEI